MFRKESKDEKVEVKELPKVEEGKAIRELWLNANKAHVEQIIKRVHALAAHAKRSHMGNTEMIDAIKTLEAEAIILLRKLL